MEHGDQVRLRTIAREWGRIGLAGFGGPPAHILLLRRLCVERRGWLSPAEFEDGIATTNLLPGPASTQLAIFTAWRLRGTAGALVGGICFIAPGLVLILALSALFLAGHPPLWVLGAAAGAGAAVPAVAVQAAAALVPGSRGRAAAVGAAAGGTGHVRGGRARWYGYALAGAGAAVLTGPWLVLVLLAAGLAEVAARSRGRRAPLPGPPAGTARDGAEGVGPDDAGEAGGPAPGGGGRRRGALPLLTAVPALGGLGGLGALAWVAFKVGALSYGGGFVIIPLMRDDAVHRYHWMTDGQFLNAVALGQVTPGPVVHTVSAVGYAAAGTFGGLLAAAVAFGPSFLFVILGARHFGRLRADRRVQDFLTGAGPAVVGAIAGSALPLAASLAHGWQWAVLAVVLLRLTVARGGAVGALLAAGGLGVVAALAGLPVT
ncbi:chromate transporter [Kitasatospora sp. NBC_00240]|uniref:chromate transporter n=1 Tax=Kitasatospora sp. NBC_00240 TaxID=2903567 RepID=UPI00224DB1E0|nr:chromate transporter [Kitasatospora sp. NBC_00240]MCX5209295.1 chromate transporter [Kitasatospora sp. NBC_00240]